MKKTALVFLSLVALTVSAQKIKETAVPEAVLVSFKSNYKDVRAKWEKEKDGNFEAEFLVNKVESSVTYSAAGKLIETEKEMEMSLLSKPITDYIHQNFSAYKITEASTITDAQGVLSYEAEISKGAKSMDLIFDEKGNFVRK